MKKLLLLFAALLPLLTSAQTKVEINDIWYNLDERTQQAEITSGDEYSNSITIPASFTYEGVDYSVTSIGNRAFFDCSSLTDITIPEGVTSIGGYAFYGCSSLTTITIPESVTSIGSEAFRDCSSLTAIVVLAGNSVYDSRGGCNAIIETNTNTLIQGCSSTIIPENVTNIGNHAFDGCSSLTAITIPEGVTSIGDGAFTYCSSLTAINIPKSVTSIGNGVFNCCCSLTAIVVLAGNLVYDSRGGCNAIIETSTNTLIQGCSSTIIPENVTNIGNHAFSSCWGITAITIPEGVTSIGDRAFAFCSSLTAINIPKSVTSFGYEAFSDCCSLTAINIPEGVTSIKTRTFFYCESLTAITLPESVTSIEIQAFSSCSNLTTIVLPKSLKKINTQAFANCSELLDVYCYAESVPWTYSDTFDGSYPEYITLHVPASALNAYKSTAPWSSFGNIVVLEDEEPLEKCTTPTISYVDGEVVFACETEGAIIKSEVKENTSGKFEGTRITLTPTYTITAYATKENYEDSDIATLTLCWIPCAEEHESEETGILTIPSKPVLISTQGGAITLSGLAADTEVAAYDATGTQLATATATGGTATLTTNLTTGDIAIVKIGEHSIKIVIK